MMRVEPHRRWGNIGRTKFTRIQSVVNTFGNIFFIPTPPLPVGVEKSIKWQIYRLIKPTKKTQNKCNSVLTKSTNHCNLCLYSVTGKDIENVIKPANTALYFVRREAKREPPGMQHLALHWAVSADRR
jgi:hypothetical protein